MTHVTFSAIPKSSYKVLVNEKPKTASVYELEKQDVQVIDDIINQHGDKITNDDIFIEACFEASQLLKMKNTQKYADVLKNTKIFAAILNKEIAGLSIMNIPKRNIYNEFVYSSRDNAPANEMELDWIAINPKYKYNTKKIGSVLRSQHFDYAKSQNCDKIYARSVLEKNTEDPQPLFFYTHCGYKQVGEPIDWELSSEKAVKICKEVDTGNSEDIVIPIEIERSVFEEKLNTLDKKLCRQNLPQVPINLSLLVK